MSDINEALILEIDRAIAEGKGAIVDGEISLAEIEKELLEKRAQLSIGQTVIAALIAKRTELLADQATTPVASNACEARSPKVPEGRTVENPAVDIQQDASERILGSVQPFVIAAVLLFKHRILPPSAVAAAALSRGTAGT